MKELRGSTGVALLGFHSANGTEEVISGSSRRSGLFPPAGGGFSDKAGSCGTQLQTVSE